MTRPLVVLGDVASVGAELTLTTIGGRDCYKVMHVSDIEYAFLPIILRYVLA